MISISGGTTVCTGGSATLQANPTGGIAGDCQIQWQLSNDNGANYQDIVGEKNKTYQITYLTKTTYFRALYNCTGAGCDSKPSDPQIVTVVDKPLVTITADQKYICQKSPIRIIASVSGGSGVSINQWQSSTNGLDWINISGETAFDYNSTTLSKTTFFRVVVTEKGDGCITISAPVLISVDGCNGAIGHFVWLDCNGNGIQDADEKGLAGVSVTLTGTTTTGLILTLTTTTDVSGYYLFTGLQAGTYRLTFGSVANVSGLTFTQKNVGNPLLDSDVDGSGKTDAIILGQSETRMDIDAGYSESVGPIFANVPKNITADCDKIPAVPTLGATDIFGGVAVVTYDSTKSNSHSGNGCAYPYTIMRKWTAKDNCGKITTAQQIITVQDTTAPVFTFVPPDVTISCKELIPNGADVKAKDNCDPNVQIITGQEIVRDPTKACKDYILYKIFTASDACDNKSQPVRQKITVSDKEPPIFVNVPRDTGVQCGQIPDINTVILTAKDNCDSNPIITAQPETKTKILCAAGYTLVRTWTVADACGNAGTPFTQIMTVTDTTRPVIVKAPLDITVDLSKGEIIPPAPIIGTDITATDNCDNNPIITPTETPRLSVGNCQSQFTRTWTAKDICGNISFPKTQTITVLELKPAVILTFSKAEDCFGNNGQVTFSPVNYTYKWSDGNTGAVRTNLKAGNYSITISSGNGCDTVLQITVVKECPNCIKPILSAVKTPVSCGKTNNGSIQLRITNYELRYPDYSVYVSTATGFDSSFIIHGASFIVPNLKIGTYTVKAVKMIDTSCYATVTIGVENTPGVNINDATIVNAGCNAITGSAAFNTNGINTYKFLWSDGNTQSARTDLAVGNYNVTISNVEQCDAVKKVKIINTGSKPIVSISANSLVSCGNTKIDFLANATPIAAYSYQWQISEDAINWIIIRNQNSAVYSNYTLQKTNFFRVIVSTQDGCTSVSEPIKIIVNTNVPLIVNVPNNITVDCNKIPAVSTDVTATDNAGFNINVTSSETRSLREIVSCQIIITRTFSAQDNCLNKATATQEITLQDTVKPVIANVPTDITVDKSKNETVPALPTNVMATDNCDAFVAVKFTESSSTTNGNCQSFIVRTWTAIDSCGNSATQKQKITIIEPTPVVTVANTKPAPAENCTDKNGAIELTPINYVYRWNDGATGATRNNLSAGIYTVRAYSSNGCFVEKDITVVRLCDTCRQPIVSVKTTDQSCARDNDGKAVITITNGNSTAYKFIWTPLISNADTAGNLPVGDYTVRVQKSAQPNCFTDIKFRIKSATDVVIDTPNIANANCTQGGSISFNADLNYTFIWNDGDTNRIRKNLLAGNYAVTVSRTGQCPIAKSFSIIKDCAAPVDSCKIPLASLTKTDPICGGNTNTGSIQLLISMRFSALVYNVHISSAVGFDSSFTVHRSPFTVSNLIAGNYTIKIKRTDNTVCDTTIQFSIIGTNKLLVDAPVIKSADCTSPTGSIDYSTPANIGLKFRWNDLDTNRLRTKLLPGIYVVTISDPNTNRCPFTDSLSVPLNNPLHTSSAILKQPSCGKPNGVVKLTTTGGSGQYIYSWGEGSERYVLPAGTTTVTVTDFQTGCEISVTFNLINQNIEAVLVSDTAAHLTCNGSADGYLNYSVTPGEGFTLPVNIELHDSRNLIYTNGALQAGKYIFQVKDATGCVAVERNVTVTQPDILAATFTKRNQSCDSSGRVTLNVTGGNVPYRYLWSDANGFTTDNAVRDNLQSGYYSVTVLDAGSCLLTVKNISILDSCKCRLPVIDSVSTTPATCGLNNGKAAVNLKATVNSLNKYQFDWIPDSGNSNTFGNERTSLGGGVYSVIVSQRSNPSCFINATVGVGSLQGPKNITVVTAPASCEAANGTATLTPLPADSLTYTWLFDNSNAVLRHDLKAGFYQVLAARNSLPDCPTLINVRIDSKNILAASAQTVKKATCGLSNGSIQLRITNYDLRDSLYLIHIKGSDIRNSTSGIVIDSSFIVHRSSFIVPNLKSGVYAIDITDQQTKCHSIVTYILENENIAATSIILSDTVVYTHCATTTDAQIQFQIANYGTHDSLYLMDDNGRTIRSVLISMRFSTFVNLGLGKYCFVVKDANNCITASKCFDVKNPQPIVAVTSKTNATCTDKGSINITVTGGTGNFNYQWSDSPVVLANQRTDLNTGTYSVTVTDNNGCNIILDTLNIRNDCPAQPNCSVKAKFVAQNATCTHNGSINIVINGGVAPYKTIWSDLTGANNAPNRTDLQAGTYSVIVSDATGCADTLKNIIILNKCSTDTTKPCTPPSITSISVNDARCGLKTGSVSIHTTENNLIFKWLPEVSTASHADDISAGLYHVRITRTNDTACFTERDIIVKNIDGIKIDAPVTTPATCASSNGTARFASGVGAFQYIWSDGKTGFSRNNLAAGQYFVTISDPERIYCDQIIGVEIKSTNSLTVTTVIDRQPSCKQNDGQATVNIRGGSGIYQLRIANYELRIDSVFNLQSSSKPVANLQAGNYAVTVTDAVSGCTSITSVVVTNAVSSGATINLPADIIFTSCAGTNDASVVFNVTASVSGLHFIIRDARSAIIKIDTIKDTLPLSVLGLGTGKYTIEVTNVSGCIIAGENFQVSEPTPIIVSAQTQAQKCTQGGSITVNATGGTGIYQLRITNNALRIDSLFIVHSSSFIFPSLKAGNYAATITDSRGCSAIVNNISVANDSVNCSTCPAHLSTVSVTDKTCNVGGSIKVNPIAGEAPYQLRMTNAALHIDSALTIINSSLSIINLKAGVYEIFIIDAKNCKDTLHNVIIRDNCNTQTCILSVTAQTKNKDCNGSGAILLTVNGGGGKYGYLWNDGNTSSARSGLNAGVYAVIVLDSVSLCIDTLRDLLITDTCNHNTMPCTLRGATIVTAKNCNTSGSITASATGGQSPYIFDWLDLAGINNGSTRTGLNIGTYTVVVIDTKGCRDTVKAVVLDSCTSPLKCTLSATPTVVNKTCDKNGSISAVITGGQTPYKLSVVNNQLSVSDSILTGTIFALNNLNVGVFMLIVIDANGCKDTMSSVVVKNDCNGSNGCTKPAIVSVSTVDASCTARLGVIRIDLANNTNDSVYRVRLFGVKDSVFVIKKTSFSINNLRGGTYTVKIMRGADTTCFIQQNFIIKNSDGVNIGIPVITPSSCAANNGTADFGNANGLIFTWSDGKQIAKRTDLAKGIYFVTVSDSTKILCDQVAQVDIPAVNTLTATSTITKSATCGQSNGSFQIQIANYELRDSQFLIHISALGFDSSFNVRGSSFIVPGLNSGIYSIAISNSNACPIILNNIIIANDSVNCVSACTSKFDTQTTYAVACGEKAKICTQLNQTDTLNYKIFDNGILYTGGFAKCDADTSVSYTYYTLIQRDPNGPWHLDEWMINGQLHQGIFNNITALADSMNVWDAPHKWQTDTKTYSLFSVGNKKRYNKMLWSKNGLPIAELNPSVFEQYHHYGIQLDSGTHTLIIVAGQTCRDTAFIKVISTCTSPIDTTPLSCGKLIEGATTYNVPCGEKANVCTKLSGTDTLVYKIYDNGNRYTDGFTKCAADTSVGYNYFTLVLSSANGPWTLNEWLINGQLHKGVFSSIQTLTDSMSVWDAPNKWILDTKTFTIYSINNPNFCNAMLWSKNGKPVAQLMSSYDEIYRQVGLKLNNGAHQIIFENTVLHCRDTAQINVRCYAVIGGTTRVEAKVKEKEKIDSVSVKIPRLKAVNDHAMAYQYQTVQIEPMLNDSLGGEKAIILLVEPPTYGRAVLNRERGIVAYTPQENPCEKRDSFRYALVTANARDTAWITIEVVCDDLIVFTGFSPNGDGINDFFVIKGLENYKNNRLMIYNRFGNSVYETKNYQNDWGGTYNGKNLPDGTYFYIIDLGNGDQKSGYVQIQR